MVWHSSADLIFSLSSHTGLSLIPPYSPLPAIQLKDWVKILRHFWANCCVLESSIFDSEIPVKHFGLCIQNTLVNRPPYVCTPMSVTPCSITSTKYAKISSQISWPKSLLDCFINHKIFLCIFGMFHLLLTLWSTFMTNFNVFLLKKIFLITADSHLFENTIKISWDYQIICHLPHKVSGHLTEDSKFIK